MTRIMGIDPGPTESAWAVWDGERILSCGKTPNHAFEPALSAHLDETEVAIEMIASYGMAVGAEVFETCVWIGRFEQQCIAANILVRRVFRKDVKIHLCHSMKAKDSNIRAALVDRFGPGKDKAIGRKKTPGPLYGVAGDVWSALAVAITAREAA